MSRAISIREFDDLPADQFSLGISPHAGLTSITPGPDGALWFTERRGHRIGRITTAGGVTEIPTGSPSSPSTVVAGRDGALWFTENEPARIARITTSGQITEFSGLTARSAPTCIVPGPDGNMWFGETGGNRIGRVNLR